MFLKNPFNEKKYILEESLAIKKRVSNFDRVYLEFGGHLINDYHASRVLPGYKKHTKLNLLKSFRNDLEIIYCIYSKHLNQKHTEYNSSEDFEDLVSSELRTLEKNGFKINSVVITRFDKSHKDTLDFVKKLRKQKRKVYLTTPIKGYPNNLKIIFGKNGFMKEPYIKTSKKIVIVTGPVANSGKMGVCLSQVFLDSKENIHSGYAKLETFPIWNLPLNDPINLAYEAATADVGDYNMVDPFYKKAYGKIAINYNRDIENFSILLRILNKLPAKNYMHNYKSPTDMGINKIKDGIIDLDKVHSAAIKEIKRRSQKYLRRYKQGIETKETIERMNNILKKIK